MKIDCIFKTCKNVGVRCDVCRFNKFAELESHLVLEDEEKEIRYLER